MLVMAACSPEIPHALWGVPVEIAYRDGAVSRVTHASDGMRVEATVIREINPSVASKLRNESVLVFESLFERQRVGYKGQHTEFVECPPAFRPARDERVLDGGAYTYFVGYANDRFVPGACDAESATYRFVRILLVCEAAEAFVEADYFVRNADDAEVAGFLDRISCAAADLPPAS